MAALLLVVLSLLMAALMVVAGPAAAADGALTPEQEKLASQIDGKLIAPCCWTQTVSLHESQKAEEIKMQVRLFLAQGKGEGEILDNFVGQYGEQILAAPRASGFNLLAYLLPLTVLVVGLGGIALLVVRWRTRQPAMVPVAVESRRSPSGDEEADDLRRRLEDDLSHFDS
jgi:cytochrome c-type biogenesis protein CcmH